ncbi:FIG00652649: hypothetical protein [hydrothermal vent metagenome]|uniref:Putative auto-transporter adhesin head GIN domain-containing protein n=1 Tax=hydrothermal vent metagenome TaxID=652676 RepID=A0A3B0TT99_9ZZZZ
MKTIKQIFFFVLTVFFLGAAFSASATSEKSKRKVTGFSGIQISSGIDLYLKMGDSEEVIVVADDDIIDDIITKVEDGVLEIYMKRKIWWWWNINRKVYVTAKELNKLYASAGSDVESENTITDEELDIKVSSGSDVKMEVKVVKLKVKSSSGSDVKLTGIAKEFDADASSGSDIHAAGLKTENCRVEVSSGSDASVYVTNELYARASSGGDIRYSGNPEHKDIHESSGGGIYKR